MGDACGRRMQLLAAYCGPGLAADALALPGKARRGSRTSVHVDIWGRRGAGFAWAPGRAAGRWEGALRAACRTQPTATVAAKAASRIFWCCELAAGCIGGFWGQSGSASSARTPARSASWLPPPKQPPLPQAAPPHCRFLQPKPLAKGTDHRYRRGCTMVQKCSSGMGCFGARATSWPEAYLLSSLALLPDGRVRACWGCGSWNRCFKVAALKPQVTGQHCRAGR